MSLETLVTEGWLPRATLDNAPAFPATFEHQQPTIPEATPLEVLRYLMEEHGLTQMDLAVEMGGQSVVSAILRGKRQLNARHIAALAVRFHVSLAVFF